MAPLFRAVTRNRPNIIVICQRRICVGYRQVQLTLPQLKVEPVYNYNPFLFLACKEKYPGSTLNHSIPSSLQLSNLLSVLGCQISGLRLQPQSTLFPNSKSPLHYRKRRRNWVFCCLVSYKIFFFFVLVSIP